ERGLKAHYTGRYPQPFGPQLREPRNDNERAERNAMERVSFDRRDDRVAFSFGAQSPSPERLRADEFNIRWEGSVFAEETGAYEFIVKSENGVRLWVNDTKTMLIDAWVSSGPNVREEKKSIFLLGGRSYPLVLEF